MENNNKDQQTKTEPTDEQTTTPAQEQTGQNLPAAQPKPVENHPPELVEFMDYMKENGARLLINIGVAAIIILGAVVYTTYRKNTQNESMEMLSKARSLQDAENIAGKYPNSAAAPLALLQMANISYDSGNYDMALAKFNEFKNKHPKHEFIDVAEIGSIHCIEASGQIQQALDAFSAFADSKPGHYLRTEALFGKARCFEQLGKLDEARTVYEDIIAADPKSGWAPRAEESLDLIKIKLKRGTKITSPTSRASILEKAPQLEQKSIK